MRLNVDAQPAIICSHLTTNTIEQGVKLLKGKDKDTRTTLNDVILVSLLLTTNKFLILLCFCC